MRWCEPQRHSWGHSWTWAGRADAGCGRDFVASDLGKKKPSSWEWRTWFTCSRGSSAPQVELGSLHRHQGQQQPEAVHAILLSLGLSPCGCLKTACPYVCLSVCLLQREGTISPERSATGPSVAGNRPSFPQTCCSGGRAVPQNPSASLDPPSQRCFPHTCPLTHDGLRPLPVLPPPRLWGL